jgi:hypothetical protein
MAFLTVFVLPIWTNTGFVFVWGLTPFPKIFPEVGTYLLA